MKCTTLFSVSTAKTFFVLAPLSFILSSCDGGDSDSSESTTAGEAEVLEEEVELAISSVKTVAPESTENLTLSLNVDSATDDDDVVNLQLFLDGSNFSIGDNNQSITYDYDYVKVSDEVAQMSVTTSNATVDLMMNFEEKSFVATYATPTEERVEGSFILAEEDYELAFEGAEHDVFFSHNPGIDPPKELEFVDVVLTYESGRERTLDISFSSLSVTSDFFENEFPNSFDYQFIEFIHATLTYTVFKNVFDPDFGFFVDTIELERTYTFDYTDNDKGTFTERRENEDGSFSSSEGTFEIESIF
jgi:hypothetical protein